MPIVEDTVAYPLMVKLAACLEAEIIAAGLPKPCEVSLMPGGDVVLDYCGGVDVNGDEIGCVEGDCGGQAWVQLVNVYPSRAFPEQDSAATCSAGRWAVVLGVGHAMCAPTMDEQGNPPSSQEKVDAVRRQTASMQAMRRAIQCCLPQGEEHDHVMGQYTADPVEGGCLVGTWQVTIASPF